MACVIFRLLRIVTLKYTAMNKFQDFQDPESDNTNFNITKLIGVDHLNSEEKSKILNICKQYKNIFYNENSDLTFTDTIKHKIRTVDDEPVYTKSYRYPYHLKQEIQNQI